MSQIAIVQPTGGPLGGTLNVVGGPCRQRPAVMSFSSHHASAADANELQYELIKRRLNDLDRWVIAATRVGSDEFLTVAL